MLIKELNVVTRGLQEPNSVFLLATMAWYLLIHCLPGLHRMLMPAKKQGSKILKC